MGEVKIEVELENFVDRVNAEQGVCRRRKSVLSRPGEPLLGQMVLEGLDLIVDCARKTLSPRPESPAYPSFKLK